MIALLAAVPFETELLRRSFGPCEVRSRGRRDLFLGRLSGHDLVLLHSGVGKAAAAAATAVLLEYHRPSAVVVTGCGGAYPGSGLKVGDLALAREEVFGDEGVRTAEGFLDVQTLGLASVERGERRLYHRFPADPFLLQACSEPLRSFARSRRRQLATGTLVTVSTCSGSDTGAEELALRTGGICESMEGAAVAQICALHDIPFLEIRGISNLAENRDLTRWDLPGAASIAQEAVKALLENWPEGDHEGA